MTLRLPLFSTLATRPQRMHSSFWSNTLLSGALWACAAPALADEPPEILLVPVARRDASVDALRELSEALDEELGRRRIPHLSPLEAQQRFVARDSRDSIPLSEPDANRIMEEAQQALEASVGGEWVSARLHYERALQSAGRALESTNRNVDTARNLWHACLLSVESHYAQGNLHAARAQAIDCRIQSPGMELEPDRSPEDAKFPHFVHELVAQAQDHLAGQRTAPIIVESTPTGCSVHLNGIRVGETRYERPHPGRKPYLVQVECGDGVGRVHTVTPGDTPVTVHVDAAFERAIDTSSGAGLVLREAALLDADGGDAEEAKRKREAVKRTQLRKLRTLLGEPGRPIPLTLLITETSGGALELWRADDGPSNKQFLDPTYSKSELRRAVDALLAPAESASTQAEPGAQSAELAPNKAHPHLGALRATLGATGMALGVALISAGWAKTGTRDEASSSLRRNADSPSSEQLVTWNDARKPPYRYAAVGASVLSASVLAMTWAVPHERTPWWVASTLAAAGGVMIILGAKDIARGGPCSGSLEAVAECTKKRDRRDDGALLVLSSLPLLSVMTLKLTRSLLSKTPSRTLSFAPVGDAKGAGLHARLTF